MNSAQQPPRRGGARKGAGRKPLPAGQARTEQVRARLTSAEYAALRAYCEERDLPQHVVLRDAIAVLLGRDWPR